MCIRPSPQNPTPHVWPSARDPLGTGAVAGSEAPWQRSAGRGPRRPAHGNSRADLDLLLQPTGKMMNTLPVVGSP